MTATIACGQLDISEISEDDVIAVPGVAAWVSFDVDEKIYEISGSPYGYAVIKFNSPCWTSVCSEDSSELVGKAFLMISNGLQTTLKTATQDPSVSGSSDLPGSGVTSTTICGVDVDLLRNMQETVDSLQINEKSFQPAAVFPNACVIPIKSNVFAYGPWASSNFATTYGGAELQVNADLTPWNFGSFSAMNLAGQELANTSFIGLSRAEKGSATLLEVPAFSLGGITNGPTLTDISVSFGSNGVTTTYNYATYTPKFGQLSRVIIDKFKKITQVRNEQLKFLRQNNIILNKISRKSTSSSSFVKTENTKSISDQNSLTRVLIGEIYNNQETLNGGSGQRTIVGMSPLSKSVLEMRGSGYQNKAFISLDALYSPVSIYGGKIGECSSPVADCSLLPRFIMPVSGTTGNPIPTGIGWSVAPHPPVIAQANAEAVESYNTNQKIIEDMEAVSIHRDYLNPLSNPGMIPHHNGSGAGHCIDIVGRETTPPTSGLITNFYRPNESGKYSNDYRFLSMRGPLVLHSWGYDTEGKPVPNEADVEDDTKKGIFKYDNLKNNFLNDWLQKPSTWPVAPVDLRLDRERGVWVSPREHKIITVELIDKLEPFGKALGKIITPSGQYKKIYDNNGTEMPMEDTRVIIEDRLGEEHVSGERSYAYFDGYSNTYLLVGGKSNSIVEGTTNGPWNINTYKAVTIPELNDITVSALNIAGGVGRNVENDYTVQLAKIGNKYYFLGGGTCESSGVV